MNSITDIAVKITDTHLKPDTIDLNRSIWRQAIQLCIARGIKKIYHLGDAFDSRKAQTQDMLLVLDELFTMVCEAGLQLIIIPGNHDKTDYKSANSFLHTFRFHPNVTVVSDFWRDGDEELGIYMLPFFDEKSGVYAEKLKPIIEEVRNNKGRKNILLTHVGINEAVMNGGSVIEEHIEGDLFKDFDKVYVGHFHDYQELQKGKIVYIRSSYQDNFGEDSNKGFTILKSDGSIELIQSEFPEYKKVVVDIDTSTKETLLELKKEYADSDDNIRIVFKGDKEKLATIDKNEFISIGIDVKTEEFDVKVLDYKEQQVSTFDSETIKEEWDLFTEENPKINKRGKEYLQKL